MDGDLVASLSAAQRVDMIQKGYVPGHQEDVDRYFRNEKPSGEAIGMVIHDSGHGFHKDMGEGHMDYKRDYQMLQSGYGREVDAIESSIPRMATPSPRAAVAEHMENYSHKEDLDSKVNRMLTNKQTVQQPRQTQQVQQVRTQPVQQRQPQPVLGPGPVRTLGVARTTTVASVQQTKDQGYKDGVKYLNTFIRLLKAPSVDKREEMITALDNMIQTEQATRPELLNAYREGLALAETKVYESIKSIKK